MILTVGHCELWSFIRSMFKFSISKQQLWTVIMFALLIAVMLIAVIYIRLLLWDKSTICGKDDSISRLDAVYRENWMKLSCTSALRSTPVNTDEVNLLQHVELYWSAGSKDSAERRVRAKCHITIEFVNNSFLCPLSPWTESGILVILHLNHVTERPQPDTAAEMMKAETANRWFSCVSLCVCALTPTCVCELSTYLSLFLQHEPSGLKNITNTWILSLFVITCDHVSYVSVIHQFLYSYV